MKHLNRLPLHILVNLLIAYLCYGACRVAFLLENYAQFGGSLTWSSMWTMARGGLLFDTSAICYTNGLYVLLALLPLWQDKRVMRGLTKWMFIIPNALAVIINLMDTAYFSFTNKRVTADVFAEFQNEENLSGIIGIELLHHWYFVVLAIALIALIVCSYRHASEVICALVAVALSSRRVSRCSSPFSS